MAKLKLQRLPTWEQRLSEYIASKRGACFDYGTNDCCTFISGAIEAMTGVDPMSEFRGKYDSLKTSLKALKEIGKGDLEKTLDAKFPKAPLNRVMRGDVVFFDGAAGVCAGRFAWFIDDDGLHRVPVEYWDKAWRIG